MTLAFQSSNDVHQRHHKSQEQLQRAEYCSTEHNDPNNNTDSFHEESGNRAEISHARHHHFRKPNIHVDDFLHTSV